MIRKTLLISLTTLFVCSVPLYAQETPTENTEEKKDEKDKDKEKEKKDGESPGADGFWQVKLGDKGEYMIALNRITSISRHQYVLDGALIVDEVTIDSAGQSLARFYHITPISEAMPGNTASAMSKRGAELIDKVTDRTNLTVQDMVVKKYPETTHARTIEYRILSETELTTIFNSAKNAWQSGRGRVISGK
jgi:hypothetical protein